MDIIEQLRDDNNYYGVLGKQYLSNSDIGTLLNNPQGYGKSRPDSKNLLEGRYFHQLLIFHYQYLTSPQQMLGFHLDKLLFSFLFGLLFVNR